MNIFKSAVKTTAREVQGGYEIDAGWATYGADSVYDFNKKIEWENNGVALGNALGGHMGHEYQSALVGAGVNKSDATTAGRFIDYSYDAATFGAAPVAGLIIDSTRDQKQKKRKKREQKLEDKATTINQAAKAAAAAN